MNSETSHSASNLPWFQLQVLLFFPAIFYFTYPVSFLPSSRLHLSVLEFQLPAPLFTNHAVNMLCKLCFWYWDLCKRLSLLGHSPELCCCRRKYFLVPVTTGGVAVAKLCLKTNPDSPLLLLLICTEHSPSESRSERTAGDLLSKGQTLS